MCQDIHRCRVSLPLCLSPASVHSADLLQTKPCPSLEHFSLNTCGGHIANTAYPEKQCFEVRVCTLNNTCATQPALCSGLSSARRPHCTRGSSCLLRAHPLDGRVCPPAVFIANDLRLRAARMHGPRDRRRRAASVGLLQSFCLLFDVRRPATPTLFLCISAQSSRSAWAWCGCVAVWPGDDGGPATRETLPSLRHMCPASRSRPRHSERTIPSRNCGAPDGDVAPPRPSASGAARDDDPSLHLNGRIHRGTVWREFSRPCRGEDGASNAHRDMETLCYRSTDYFTRHMSKTFPDPSFCCNVKVMRVACVEAACTQELVGAARAARMQTLKRRATLGGSTSRRSSPLFSLLTDL